MPGDTWCLRFLAKNRRHQVSLLLDLSKKQRFFSFFLILNLLYNILLFRFWQGDIKGIRGVAKILKICYKIKRLKLNGLDCIKIKKSKERKEA